MWKARERHIGLKCVIIVLVAIIDHISVRAHKPQSRTCTTGSANALVLV